MKSVLLISGSVRSGSVNSAVIDTVASLIDGATATVVYQGLERLPHFNPDLDFDPLPPEVADLRTAIDNASALLFSTPEYAGAMPGALKNLLEWTVGGTETTDKPTGWINPSTNPLRARNTYRSLATVLEYTDCSLTAGACRDIPVPRSAIGKDGLIHGETIRLEISAACVALLDSVT